MVGLNMGLRAVRRKYGYGAALVIVGLITVFYTIFLSKDALDVKHGIIISIACFVIGGILMYVRIKKLEKLAAEEAEAEAEAERRKRSDPHYYDNR